MLELTVFSKTPAAITAAFKKINEMVKSGSLAYDATVHLTLAPGFYHEILSYNLPNPLIMESMPGTRPENCVISAENCEAFHKDTENRAVFVIGMAATHVVLRGFTLENTHIKTNDDVSLGNQAEAFCWHNKTGFLEAQNMRFLSRQDTIHVKGFSRFSNCYVAGDVDYIWGYCDTALFEGCWMHTCEDNRGNDRPAYVLQSRALSGKPGFVFTDCTFTADKRTCAGMYIARSSGTGKADSEDRWDSVALINCTVSADYDPCFWTDEDGTREVYPPVGNAMTGWREYGTRTILENGQNIPADTSKRSSHGYIMTNKEYFAHYASASLILGQKTPSAQKSKN
jgi:pectinesterase